MIIPARGESFKEHPLANFLRIELPELIRRVADIPREFEIEGSPDKAQWTRLPHWYAKGLLQPQYQLESLTSRTLVGNRGL
jgi:hypothetical protein